MMGKQNGQIINIRLVSAGDLFAHIRVTCLFMSWSKKIPTPRLRGRGHWQDLGGCPSTPGCFIIIYCSQLHWVFDVALGPLLLQHMGLWSPWAQQLRQLSCSSALGILVP